MRMQFVGMGLSISLLWSIPFVHGQETTEIFIPMGKSPGLSHKYTFMGKIEAVNEQRRTIAADGQTIKITQKTRIWLDRTKLGLANQVGSFSDLSTGQNIEIKYADPDRKEAADWVKVEVATP